MASLSEIAFQEKKETKHADVSSVISKPKERKVVLLIKREITQDEGDQLEKVLDVTFFNDRVHTERKLCDLMPHCELLVLPIFKDNVKYWWEANEKLVDHKTSDVVLLERKSYKLKDEKEFKCDYVRKVLPKDNNKDGYLFNLLSNHMGKVEPKYKRVIKSFLCCLRSVV
jgi:hypothetical protein